LNICTWTSEDAPPKQRGLAFIYLDGERLPVVFLAETAAEAGEKARAQWEADLAKAAAQKPRVAPRKAKPAVDQPAAEEEDEPI
jgi:hypothetical protein